MDIIWWMIIGTIGVLWILVASIKLNSIDFFEETIPQENQGLMKEIFFAIEVVPYLVSFGIIYLCIIAMEKIAEYCNQ